jgi:outer membrane protein OmpA-like peptidoglycan-associated protein
MKTMTLLLVLAAAAGCGGDKPKVAKPAAPVAATPETATPETPPPAVDKDTKVSPSLALSGDLAAMCNIKAPGSTNPKFDYDKDELTPEDRTVLDQLATCLTSGAAKGKSVALIGRADPRGTEEYNLGLGTRRARTVGTYLERLGVQSTQLAETTRGALDAGGRDETGWTTDRRVDVDVARK